MHSLKQRQHTNVSDKVHAIVPLNMGNMSLGKLMGELL